MMYAIVCTQGEMSFKDVKDECVSGKWIPILVMRVDGETIIPLFESQQMAYRFRARNLPKKWICGVINVPLAEAQWLDSKGFKAVTFRYPRKLGDIVEFDIEVMECQEETELELHGV